MSLQSGIRWTRLLTRIADKRAARRTTLPLRSTVSSAPWGEFFREEVLSGSAAKVAYQKWEVIGTPGIPYTMNMDHQVELVRTEVLSDFPKTDNSQTGQAGQSAPELPPFEGLNDWKQI